MNLNTAFFERSLSWLGQYSWGHTPKCKSRAESVSDRNGVGASSVHSVGRFACVINILYAAVQVRNLVPRFPNLRKIWRSV